MSFFVTPTVYDVRFLIQHLKQDYNQTKKVLKESWDCNKVYDLFKSSLWVCLHTNQTNGQDYKVYLHKFTGCNLKVFAKQVKPELDETRRKLDEHIKRYEDLHIERLTHNALGFLSKKASKGLTNLQDLTMKVFEAYRNAIKIIEFLHTIGYKHGGEGANSMAMNKKGFVVANIQALLPPLAWEEKENHGSHFCRKSTLLPSITMGGVVNKTDVKEGALIGFAKEIQEYVNQLKFNFLKLPFGFIEDEQKIGEIVKIYIDREKKNGMITYDLKESIVEWYKHLPIFAITQYLASNVAN